MQIIAKCLTLKEFHGYTDKYDFGENPAWKLVIHHTWRPKKDDWNGYKTILALKSYYENKGWPAGPHLFVAEDGIWLFSPMNKEGIHAASLNRNSIGIEVVGDYDNEKWEGNTKAYALGAIKVLMSKLSLTNTDIYFHRDASPKSCPGWAITKEWLFSELTSYNLDLSLSDVMRNTTAPIPTDYFSSEDMVLIQVPDWAKEAVDFISVKHKLFKIRCAEDVRDAVKFYRFYKLINK